MGKDIMDTFDVKPGKVIGTIKDKIKDAIFEGIIANDRDEAIAYMVTLASELGLELQTQ